MGGLQDAHEEEEVDGVAGEHHADHKPRVDLYLLGRNAELGTHEHAAGVPSKACPGKTVLVGR